MSALGIIVFQCNKAGWVSCRTPSDLVGEMVAAKIDALCRKSRLTNAEIIAIYERYTLIHVPVCFDLEGGCGSAYLKKFDAAFATLEQQLDVESEDPMIRAAKAVRVYRQQAAKRSK